MTTKVWSWRHGSRSWIYAVFNVIANFWDGLPLIDLILVKIVNRTNVLNKKSPIHYICFMSMKVDYIILM